MMQPRRIVITYGTNNTNSTADTFKTSTAVLWRPSKRNGPTRISSSTPYRPWRRRTGTAAHAEGHRRIQQSLADLAKEDGYRFLNSSEALKDPATGFARASYMIEDGLHLNEQGAKR